MSYEPTNVPQLKEKSLDISNIRFALIYSNRFVDPQDKNIEPTHIHNHPEIFFNVSSDVSFLVENRLYTLEHGDAVYSRANDIHVCVYNSAQNHEYYCLWLDADKDTLRKIIPFEYTNCNPLFSFDEETKKTLYKLLQQLYFLQNNPSQDLEKTVCLLTILSLFKKPDDNNETIDSIPPSLQNIIEDIHLNFAEINHVNDISKRHFVSPATLNRWFKKYIHLSPREFLESKKLAYASKLLAQGVSVTDACFQAGFSDCSHFIVLFKKKFSETPLKYKQKFY